MSGDALHPVIRFLLLNAERIAFVLISAAAVVAYWLYRRKSGS